MASIDRGYGATRPTRSSSGGGGPSILGMLLGGMLAGLVFAAAIAFFFQTLYADRVVPGVSTASIDLGAKSEAEAEAAVRAGFDSLNARPFTLVSSNGRQWSLSPRDLGITLDPRATTERAFAVGKEDEFGARAASQLRALQAGIIIEPVLAIDEPTFQAAVRKMADVVERPFVDASVSLRDGRVSAIPPQAGERVDADQLRLAVQSRLLAGNWDTPIPVTMTRSEPTRTLEDIQPLVKQLQDLTGSNLVMRTPDGSKSVTVNARDLAAMVTVDDNGRGGIGALSINFDRARLNALADRVTTTVAQQPVNARYAFESGGLRQIRPGQDGLSLDKERFVAWFQETALGSTRTVELPVTVTKPFTAQSNTSTWGITERVYRQSTNYAGGAPERRQNVELGARLINGVIIPPGATFSFNEVVGAITAENGFALGFAIVENETVPDAGGGICQVSTTLFQAAFMAGYPIVERWAHAYDITRYHAPYAGLDATVYYPQLDFKFTNPQSTALLVQASTDGTNIVVQLFGTKPNWTVDVQRPVITNVKKADTTIIRQESPALARGREYWVERAEDGMDVAITRTVTEPGKEPRVGTFRSSYRPQRNILLVGTGGAPAGPAQTINAQGTPVAATATPAGTPTATPRATQTPAATPSATARPSTTPTPSATPSR